MRTSVVFIGTIVGAAAFVPHAPLPARAFAPTTLSSTVNEPEVGDASADERAAGLDPARLAERRNAIAAKRAEETGGADGETAAVLGEDEAKASYGEIWSAEEPVAEATPEPEPVLKEPVVEAPVVEEPTAEDAPTMVAAVEETLPKADLSPRAAHVAAASPPTARTRPQWAGRFAGRADSSMVPPVARAPLLDGTHAGDGGFDPLGFAVDDARLFEYQKAEVAGASVGRSVRPSRARLPARALPDNAESSHLSTRTPSEPSSPLTRRRRRRHPVRPPAHRSAGQARPARDAGHRRLARGGEPPAAARPARLGRPRADRAQRRVAQLARAALRPHLLLRA